VQGRFLCSIYWGILDLYLLSSRETVFVDSLFDGLNASSLLISSVDSPTALLGRRIIAICSLVSVNELSTELFSLSSHTDV